MQDVQSLNRWRSIELSTSAAIDRAAVTRAYLLLRVDLNEECFSVFFSILSFSVFDLNEECFSVFFSIFPKIWYFPIGKNQEMPECRENTEKKTKTQPSLRFDPEHSKILHTRYVL